MKKLLFIYATALLLIGCNQLDGFRHKTESTGDGVSKSGISDFDYLHGYKIEECISCYIVNQNGKYYKYLFLRDGKYYVTGRALAGLLQVNKSKDILVRISWGKIQEERFRSMIKPFLTSEEQGRFGPVKFYLNRQELHKLLDKKHYILWMKEHPETIILKYS